MTPKKISYGSPTNWMSNFTKWHLTHEVLPVFSPFLWNLTFIFSDYQERFSLMLLQTTNYILKNVKKNAIFFKLFWQKDFVYWKLKLINFLVDSVLSLMLSGKKDIYQSIAKSFQKSHFIRAPVPCHKKAINRAIN